MTTPENEIERLLEAAARDAGGMDLAVLANTELLVPVTTGRAAVAAQLGAGHDVPVRVFEHEGLRYVSVFTSVRQLRAAGAPEQYVVLTGAQLAVSWPPELSLVINPGAGIGATLTPDQVARLAGGTSAVLPAGASVRIGVPAEPPAESLIASVRAAVAGHRDVRAAYLFQLADDRLGARLVVGIELCDGVRPEDAMPQVASAIGAALPPDDGLDVIALSRRMLRAVRESVPPL